MLKSSLMDALKINRQRVKISDTVSNLGKGQPTAGILETNAINIVCLIITQDTRSLLLWFGNLLLR